jgi:hypothetical protein
MILSPCLYFFSFNPSPPIAKILVMTNEGSAKIGCLISGITQPFQCAAHLNGGPIPAGMIYMDRLIDHGFEISGHEGLIITSLNDFSVFYQLIVITLTQGLEFVVDVTNTIQQAAGGRQSGPNLPH